MMCCGRRSGRWSCDRKMRLFLTSYLAIAVRLFGTPWPFGPEGIVLFLFEEEVLPLRAATKMTE